MPLRSTPSGIPVIDSSTATRAGDRRLSDTWRRVAGALAGVEAQARLSGRTRFLFSTPGFGFIPGAHPRRGRYRATRHAVQLLRYGAPRRQHRQHFRASQEGALTMQQGGGVGYDFSHCVPPGAWLMPPDASPPDLFHSCISGMRCVALSYRPGRGVGDDGHTALRPSRY